MPRILVVDDSDDNRVLLATQLKRHGFEVVVAAGGQEGIDKAMADLPDLILMDMTMPGVDGWEATTTLRENGSTTPIIAVTAHAMDGDRERALEAGCSDYHTKPVEIDDLLAIIEQLLRGNDR